MHQYRETQTHYLILLWFVREVAQAVGGEVSMGSSWATCKKKKGKTRLGPERPAETTELQMRHLWAEEKVESQKRKGTRESTRREPEN